MATTTTLSNGTTTLTPPLVLGYDAARRPSTVVHEPIASAAPVVTLGPVRLRRGTLEVFALTHADAAAVVALHTPPGVLTLTDTHAPGLGMRYVVADGDVTVQPVGSDLRRWSVRVPFVEVP